MTIFTFQLTEATLKAALGAMDCYLKTANQELVLQISVDIVPDGVSCEAINPKLEVVVVQPTPQETAVPQLYYDAFFQSSPDM